MSDDKALIPAGGRVIELADMMPVMIALVAADSRYLFVNKALARWLGCRRSEIIGKEVADVLDMDDADETNETRRARIHHLAKNGGEVSVEVGVRHPSGERRCVSVRLVGHENRIGVYVFLEDITQRKEAEAREARLKAILDSALDGVIVMDEAGVIDTFNTTAEKMFGYRREEVIGQCLEILMPEPYKTMHRKGLERYLASGEKRVIGSTKVEVVGLRSDGTTFPVGLAIEEFFAGERRYFTGSVRDITERKKYEASLVEWNTNLEAEVARRGRTLDRIFDLSNDLFGVCNHEGHYEVVSPAIVQITGVPLEEAKKRPFMEFVHPDDREATEKVFAELLNGQPACGFENRYVHVDGSFRWLQWNVTPSAEDQLIYFVARDVTQEKIREESLRQSQKMEAIGQLTGGIAHDFNNLLMGITGCLDLMERKIDPDSKAAIDKYMKGASTSAKRAAALTHRLLAFSRRQPLDPSSVNVNTLTESMRDLMERSIGPSIKVSTVFASDVWPTLCDPNQLESALLNLVINSRDAMTNGGNIVISTANVTSAECTRLSIPLGEYVSIAVSDNGSGMSPAVLEKVFDPFFTTKPIGQGTGLGLSMLYGFVNQSGGHVRVKSTEGVGTKVTIYLPRQEAAPEDPKQEAPASVSADLVRKGQTILVVEDEPVVRSLVVDVLEQAGYQCIETPEGNSALNVIASDQRIDLLVSDVGLPGLNGKQVAELARQQRPGLKVLFITGYAAGLTIRNDFLCEGMDIILKPFAMETLVSKVSEMIDQEVK